MATRSGRAASAREQLAEYRRKRDFTKTAEPSGDAPSPEAGALRFVIQKHAATRLHFDLRLELDGVMKSWAVPKGPSTDPSVKRLAMQVEDHPIDYNEFEGIIPKGEYGGGTVMLWDNGTYTAESGSPQKAEESIREGLKKGDLKIRFFGKRMHGSWVLVRTKAWGGRSSSDKPQWLLIKHRDEFASESDVTAGYMTSVTTGRSMEEIAQGKSKVWHSNRTKRVVEKTAPAKTSKRGSNISELAKLLEPMYASVGTSIPKEGWTFEPKYDGIRVLAFVTDDEVRLITRNGKDKSEQFPEVVDALREIAAKRKKPFVLDGEIVALIDGKPGRFQELQSRMHVKEAHLIERHRTSSPAALILFDVLLAGNDVLVKQPWTKRRARLVKEIEKAAGDVIRLTESIEGNGEKMMAVAEKKGWEGIIAKRTDSIYEPGVRSRAWIKLKIEFRQEFVVGGFTEPRNSRQHIGALLLGYYDGDRLIYVGHTGGGFTADGLVEMYKKLKPLETGKSPFQETPDANEKPHFVKPKVVVEVKFNEWTGDGKLRQPIYLGTRDDKRATEVGRETMSMQKKGAAATKPAGGTAGGNVTKSKARQRVYTQRTVDADDKPAGAGAKKATARARENLIAQLEELEKSKKSGTITISPGVTLDVTNLGKVFFPKEELTKGDLMRYYVKVAPFMLPVMADRPLVLKRFPNGVSSPAFFQQNAGETPDVVRTETIHTQGGSTNLRVVGGDLATLLYTVQLGAVSVDPWHARVPSLDHADYSIIDLDPGPRATFHRVVEVARWVKEAMDSLGLHGALKTSGSRGLHIYLPLPPSTPNEASTLVAQIVATKVSAAHPREATVERAVKARGATQVYVDYLQNIVGKTVAAAYSARANPDAMVSTPLDWEELDDEDLAPGKFTIVNAPDRFAELGDVWAGHMKRKNSLRALV